MEFKFPRTFGQNEAKENLRQTLTQGRFPHALLVHGESGLGQQALLLDLAQILVCESKVERPCGKCFSCKSFETSSLESIHYLIPLVKKEKKKKEIEKKEVEKKEVERDVEAESDEDSLNDAQIDELSGLIKEWHEQPYTFAVEEKASVHVSQTGELLGRLGYAGDRNKVRIVLIPFLEDLIPAAANKLLKTLEEPADNVYFLIASDNRASLLPTLLSRCVQIGLSPLSTAEFLETASALSVQVGKPVSQRLLPFAEGSPGVYLDLLENGGEELLEEAGKFLAAATASDWRIFADYAGEMEGLEETARLLHFLLRCVRVHQSMKVNHPDSSSLSVELSSLEKIADLPAFVVFLQTAFQAVKGYSKPQIALIGLFLEYEAKVHR